MYIATVIGSVVCTVKDDTMNGASLLIVAPTDASGTIIKGRDTAIAVDTVGAGRGEVVMVTTGSAARHTLKGALPSDAAIVGIVDSLELDGSFTFKAN